MANWVTCRIVINGPVDPVRSLILTNKDGQDAIDFNKILPMPSILEDTAPDLPLEAERATGYKTWYDWRIANWGTKWNAHDFEEISREEDRWEFLISTAWSPPIPVLKRISEQFTDVRIDLVFVDDCGDFAGAEEFG